MEGCKEKCRHNNLNNRPPQTAAEVSAESVVQAHVFVPSSDIRDIGDMDSLLLIETFF